MVDDDPLQQLDGCSRETVSRMKQAAKRLLDKGKMDISSPTLWELRNLPREAASKRLEQLSVHTGGRVDLDKLLDSLYSLPCYSLKDVKVTHEVAKSSGKSIGKLQLSLSIEPGGRKGHHSNGRNDFMTLTIVLGSPQRRTLLAHSSIGIPTRGGNKQPQEKQVELEFDWAAANADGEGGGGHMMLRLLLEDFRGMDTEILVAFQ
jgi:hypothetical protein